MDEETISDILSRVERNTTLFGFSQGELEEALKHATKEIHRYELKREIKKIKRQRPPTTRSDGMTRVHRKGRAPTKRVLR